MDGTINNISQPITAAQSSQYSGSENQISVREPAEGQAESTYGAVSSHGDTLSISEAGKAANSDTGDKVVRLSSSEADSTASLRVSEENFTESESDLDSDDATSTINLSGYTDYELKQLYLDGDITKIEYDQELSSREVAG